MDEDEAKVQAQPGGEDGRDGAEDALRIQTGLAPVHRIQAMRIDYSGRKRIEQTTQ
eukprot:COSAG06_NODE_3361_length_5453_cov_8.336758_6_plen_56_part_00